MNKNNAICFCNNHTQAVCIMQYKENEVCPLLFMVIVICQIIQLEFNNQPCMNQYSSHVRHWISDLRIRGLCILLVNQTFLRRAGKVQDCRCAIDCCMIVDYIVCSIKSEPHSGQHRHEGERWNQTHLDQ